MVLSNALILPVSHLQIQQVMTSQIRSHIEYFTHLLYSYAHVIIKNNKKI